LGSSYTNLARQAYLRQVKLDLEIFYQQRQFEEVSRVATEIREKIERDIGDNNIDHVTDLEELALLFQKVGDYSTAKLIYEKVLQIRRTVLGKKHLEYADSLNNIGKLYNNMRDFSKAKRLFEEALEIRRSTVGEKHAEFARNLGNLGDSYFKEGNYSKAEFFYQKALDITRITLGEKDPYFAVCLSRLASSYQRMGDYSTARRLFEEALEIRRGTVGEKHADFIDSLMQLAMVYTDMLDYDLAGSFFQKGLEICSKTQDENDPIYARYLNDSAQFYQKSGLLSKEKMNNYSKAESLNQKALEIRKRALGENDPAVALSLYNLGWLYHEMGEYSKAESFYLGALEIWHKTLGENHAYTGFVLDKLGWLYVIMGEYSKAESLYQRALENRRHEPGKYPELPQTLYNLGALYALIGRATEAMKVVEEGNAIEDSLIGQISSNDSERQRMLRLQVPQERINGFLSIVVKYFFSSQEAVQSGLDLVLKRKALGNEMIAAQRRALRNSKSPKLKSKIDELRNLRTLIVQKTLAEISYSLELGEETYENHQKILKEWSLRKERLEAELMQDIPEMRMEQKLKTYNWIAVAKALPKGTALIEIVHVFLSDFIAMPPQVQPTWSPNYLAFVVNPRASARVQLINLGDAQKIDEMVTEFISSVTYEVRHKMPISKIPKQDTIEKGSTLRNTIFDPLKPAIANCKRLLISPDWNLTRLPFEALPNNNDCHKWLVDDFHISYLSAGRDLLRFDAKENGLTSDPLVLADPDFDLGNTESSKKEKISITMEIDDDSEHVASVPTRLYFDRLSQTRMEGEQIARLLNVQPILGENVLEARLKACGSPRILHMATHGFFRDDPKDHGITIGGSGATINPMPWDMLEDPLFRSGLALAGANTWAKGGLLPKDAEDGILTAAEVVDLDLSNTELVVLSACDTGLGDLITGEGVFGFRRSFVLAGAQSLVMSLWKVSDEQTCDLMVDFYTHLSSGRSPARSLRCAQVAMRKKYPNPYYWGAFICQGKSWSSTKTTSSS
jgi:CHAT domain-containing protein/Tfp pilus assembly protein PilF